MLYFKKNIDIGFIWLVRQEFRQGKSWKAICTSQIFDMLGAKEMRKRDRGKELKLEERKKRACFDLDIGPVNLITQPTDNGDISKDTEKVREITQRLTDTWSYTRAHGPVLTLVRSMYYSIFHIT